MLPHSDMGYFEFHTDRLDFLVFGKLTVVTFVQNRVHNFSSLSDNS